MTTSGSSELDRGNLFDRADSLAGEEKIDRLVSSGGVRIERIVSHGHRSPQGFWYDQEEEEWVVVLRGRARLEFDPGGEVVDLEPGDWIRIPAHRRHRVAWTEPDVDTVWLAVFLGESR